MQAMSAKGPTRTRFGFRMPTNLASHLEAWAFWYLAMLYLVPIWAFPYLPTQDGPSHLANAEILLHYGSSAAKAEDFFEIRAEFLPNWTSHLLLAALMQCFPALVAEKLLVTLYILGFAGSFRYFVGSFGSRSRALSWLCLLFVYNRAFWMGFYNYCLSLIFVWIILGLCVRRRGKLSLLDATALMTLFTLAYFTHLVGFLLSVVGAIGAVLLAGIVLLGEVRNANAEEVPLESALLKLLASRVLSLGLVVCAALPATCLTMDYFEQTGFFRDGAGRRLVERPRALVQGQHPPTRFMDELKNIDRDLLDHHAGGKLSFSMLFVQFLVALAVYTLIEHLLSDSRNRIGVGWLFPLLFGLALIAFYPLLPNDLGMARGNLPHGGFLRTRLAVVPFLLWLGCVREPTNLWVRVCLRALMVAMLAVNLALVTYTFVVGNDMIAEYTAGVDAAGHGERIFVSQSDQSRFPLVNPLLHAADYYCLDSGNVNLNNYEANTPHFPVKFRPGLTQGVGNVASYRHRDAVDVVLCWRTGAPATWPGHPGWVQLFSEGPLQIYRTAGKR